MAKHLAFIELMLAKPDKSDNELHPSKHDSPRVSIEIGRLISVRFIHSKNVLLGISDICGSPLHDIRLEHPMNTAFPIVTFVEGNCGI